MKSNILSASLKNSKLQINHQLLFTVLIVRCITINTQTFNLQSVVMPVLILLIHSSEKCRGELQYKSLLQRHPNNTFI